MKKIFGWVVFIFGIIGLFREIFISILGGIIGPKELVETLFWILLVAFGWMLANFRTFVKEKPLTFLIVVSVCAVLGFSSGYFNTNENNIIAAKLTPIQVCNIAEAKLTPVTLYYSDGLVRCVFNYQVLDAEYLTTDRVVKSETIKSGTWLVNVQVHEEWWDLRSRTWVSRGEKDTFVSIGRWNYDELSGQYHFVH